MKKKPCYSEKWVGRHTSFPPSRYVKGKNSICYKKKSAGFAENDVRVPPTNLVCAFLKYGKLEAAEPCGATDQCSLIQPAIQFSKNFLFDDIEWVDEFLDPGIATTIGKMDNISERVNTFLLSGRRSSQPLIILWEAAKKIGMAEP